VLKIRTKENGRQHAVWNLNGEAIAGIENDKAKVVLEKGKAMALSQFKVKISETLRNMKKVKLESMGTDNQARLANRGRPQVPIERKIFPPDVNHAGSDTTVEEAVKVVE
jgi:hypothetical protein